MIKSNSTNTTDIELRNCGLITLCNKIANDSIDKVIRELLYMNAIEKPEFKNIQIILNSSGGDLYASFMLTDFIDYSRLPVFITGLGVCASSGILILCSGEKGYRTITNNTSLLSHQYSWYQEDKYHEMVATRKQQDLLQERIINHYIKHTKLNRKKIIEILLPKSDVWLTAREAKKYGIIDKIIDKEIQV